MKKYYTQPEIKKIMFMGDVLNASTPISGGSDGDDFLNDYKDMPR